MATARVGNMISRQDVYKAHPAAQGILDEASHADNAGSIKGLIEMAERLGLTHAGIIAPDTGEFDVMCDAMNRLERHLETEGFPLMGEEIEATTINLELHNRLRNLASHLVELTHTDVGNPGAVLQEMTEEAEEALKEDKDGYVAYYERYALKAEDYYQSGSGIRRIYQEAAEDRAPQHILDRIKEIARQESGWAQPGGMGGDKVPF